jgi:hypothetical protein
MRERLAGVTVPEAGRLKLQGSRRRNRSRHGRMERGPLVLESSTQAAPDDWAHTSNTFVAICTEDVISLLKTWVSTHTLKVVAVYRECRFVWQ